MGEHGDEIDIAVEDYEDGTRGGCGCCWCGTGAVTEEIIFGVEDVVAEFAVELGGYHFGGVAFWAADYGDDAWEGGLAKVLGSED